MSKWIVLDRDGVINVDSDNHIRHPDEWEPIPGSLEALGKLCAAGYKLALATNQSGIARGYFSESTLHDILAKMQSLAETHGATFSAMYYCPHGPDDDCDCRKPEPGMLVQFSEDHAVELTGIPYIGDSIRDLEAGLAAGARPVLVRTGNGVKSEALLTGELKTATQVFDSLAAFAEDLLRHE